MIKHLKLDTDFAFKFIMTSYGILLFSLIGNGACSLADESRYWHTADYIWYLSNGNIKTAFFQLFSEGGRPGLVIAQIPSVICQSVLYKICGVDPRSIDSLIIPQVFNWATILYIVWCIYYLCQNAFGFDKYKSTITCIFYILLVSTSLYVRHLLPYSYGLAAFLTCWVLVYKQVSSFKIGMLSAFAFTIYPGNAWFIILILIALIYHKQKAFGSIDWLFFIKVFFKFGLGICATIFGFELLSQWTENSYIVGIIEASHTFVNDFKIPYDGSVIFILDYINSVEGIFGCFLLVGFIFYFFGVVIRLFSKRQIDLLGILTIAIIFGHLFQASIGYYLGYKVYYLRLIYPYLPFIVLTTIDFIFSSSTVPYATFKCMILIVFGLWNMYHFYRDYRSLGYPRDIYNELGILNEKTGKEYDICINSPSNQRLNQVFEYNPFNIYTTPPQGLFVHYQSVIKPDSNYIFLNFSSLPYNDKDTLTPLNSQLRPEWILKKPHYKTFMPYWFDEDPKQKRNFLGDYKLMIGVYKK
ncbi:MAG: hypothetical protein ABIO44_04170 [Saprospiraceae bacterium]